MIKLNEFGTVGFTWGYSINAIRETDEVLDNLSLDGVIRDHFEKIAKMSRHTIAALLACESTVMQQKAEINKLMDLVSQLQENES